MIGSCAQRGNYVEVYDESGHRLFMQYGTLVGYTGNTVSVKRDNYIETYDEQGHRLYSNYSN